MQDMVIIPMLVGIGRGVGQNSLDVAQHLQELSQHGTLARWKNLQDLPRRSDWVRRLAGVFSPVRPIKKKFSVDAYCKQPRLAAGRPASLSSKSH